MLSFPKWIIAGAIGGLVGGAIWAGISYATNYEIGWIAWGVGLLVGVCVRVSAGEHEEGFAPGLTAAVVAIVAVLGGKYAAYSMQAASVRGEILPVLAVDADDVIMSFADEIVHEREERGQTVAFPAGKSVDTATSQADYPPDVWQQASQKWQAIGPAEQEKKLAERREEIKQWMSVMGNALVPPFSETFSLFDALWFFLAAGTAYKLGHGNIASSDDD
jgi:hypothetical protein